MTTIKFYKILSDMESMEQNLLCTAIVVINQHKWFRKNFGGMS